MFVVFGILFALGASFFSNLLHFAIQRGQIFGFWQTVLDKIYGSKLRPIGKFLGDCYLCFSNAIAIVFFAAYAYIFYGDYPNVLFWVLWFFTFEGISVWVATKINENKTQ